MNNVLWKLHSVLSSLFNNFFHDSYKMEHEIRIFFSEKMCSSRQHPHTHTNRILDRMEYQHHVWSHYSFLESKWIKLLIILAIFIRGIMLYKNCNRSVYMWFILNRQEKGTRGQKSGRKRAWNTEYTQKRTTKAYALV